MAIIVVRAVLVPQIMRECAARACGPPSSFPPGSRRPAVRGWSCRSRRCARPRTAASGSPGPTARASTPPPRTSTSCGPRRRRRAACPSCPERVVRSRPGHAAPREGRRRALVPLHRQPGGPVHGRVPGVPRPGRGDDGGLPLRRGLPRRGPPLLRRGEGRHPPEARADVQAGPHGDRRAGHPEPHGLAGRRRLPGSTPSAPDGHHPRRRQRGPPDHGRRRGHGRTVGGPRRRDRQRRGRAVRHHRRRLRRPRTHRPRARRRCPRPHPGGHPAPRASGAEPRRPRRAGPDPAMHLGVLEMLAERGDVDAILTGSLSVGGPWATARCPSATRSSSNAWPRSPSAAASGSSSAASAARPRNNPLLKRYREAGMPVFFGEECARAAHAMARAGAALTRRDD